MRTRENDPSLKNKSCDVRSFDLADFDDESRGAALEQIERHHARIKEAHPRRTEGSQGDQGRHTRLTVSGGRWSWPERIR